MTKTSHFQTNQASTSSVEDLRSRVAGEVITPGGEQYDIAREVHDLTVERYPSLIVRAASAADVSEGIRFARENGYSFSVRSGGHSIPHYSVIDNTVTIDVSQMKAVSIDAATQTARVQSGATSGELINVAHAYGLSLSTGDTSTVGIAGLTLGGGIGWMVRKYGLAIDNLLSVELVTAEGDVIRASKTDHAELFWALRGGGGNFGVVTEFEFRMAPVGAVYAGAIVLPLTREVVRGYLELASAAPDDLTTITFAMHAPPAPFIPEESLGAPSLMIVAVWTGETEEGERVLAPMRALATPIADTVGEIPYPVIYEYMAAAAARHGAAVRSLFTNEITDQAIDDIIASLDVATSPASMIQFRVLGGAMRRVSRDETAFAHRDSEYMLAVLGLWFDPNEDAEPHRAWTDDLWLKIRPLADGVYVNFLEREGDGRVREAYPNGTYQRLAQVKRQYDPENVFEFNQNIRPAAVIAAKAA